MTKLDLLLDIKAMPAIPWAACQGHDHSNAAFLPAVLRLLNCNTTNLPSADSYYVSI